MKIKTILLFFALISLLFFAWNNIAWDKITVRYLPSNLKKILFLKEKTSSVAMPVPEDAGDMVKNIYRALYKLEVHEDEIKSDLYLEERTREIKATIPMGRPIEIVLLSLKKVTSGTAYYLSDCISTQDGRVVMLSYRSKKKRDETISLLLKRGDRYFSNSGKIAILVRKFEFTADKKSVDFLSFPKPMTFIMDPFSSKSSWSSQAANEYNKEVVIELPLESLYRKSKGNTIHVQDSEEKIRKILAAAEKNINNFAGYSVMENSFLLNDSRVMGVVSDYAVKRHAYVVWDKSLNSTKLPDIVFRKRIPHAVADMKLSVTTDSLQMRNELNHFIVIAQNRNKLLLTVEPSTLLHNILIEMKKDFKRNGIRLVYLSEIVSDKEEENELW